MKPKIDRVSFGSITIGDKEFKYDVVIDLHGTVAKRKKELSKEIYGTSHMISLDEAQHVYQTGTDRLIVGTGHFGRVKLSGEAAEYLQERGCRADLLSLKKAIKAWNEAHGNLIGLFHVTC